MITSSPNLENTLETDRLTMRPFQISDSKFIIQLLNSKGWLQFIGDRNVHNEEDAKNYLINGPFKSYQENGFGLSLVEHKLDKIPMGMCGLLKRDFLDHPDIGFAFLPEYYGNGYAHEIANATVQHAKHILKLETVYAVVMPENLKSKKLLEKIGMRYVRPVTFPSETNPLLLYSTRYSS